MLNLAKKSQKKNYRKVLAFDLGGTKLAVAVVDERGHVLESKRELVELHGGAKSLVEQFARLGRPLIEKYKLKKGAIASAGPLDPIQGRLLNPTNLKTLGHEWGVVPLVKLVEKKLKIKLKLENDAASAAQAETWVGVGRKSQDVVVVTLGTGLGVGVIANGQLVRSGRHLHTEAGHIIIDYKDRSWLCGCGNYGCAEAFLSGRNFTLHLAQAWSEPHLTGEELVARARRKDQRVTQEFAVYGERLASFLCSLVVMFSPEKVILSGGFSHAADLFLPACETKLTELLKTRRLGVDLLPQILISKFRDEAGLIGAASVSFSNQ